MRYTDGTCVTHDHLSSVIESILLWVMIPLEDEDDEDGEDDEDDEDDEDEEDEEDDENDEDDEDDEDDDMGRLEKRILCFLGNNLVRTGPLKKKHPV